MSKLVVLGLNCGTSVDGIDASVCEISVAREEGSFVDLYIRPIIYTKVPVSSHLKKKILESRDSAGGSTATICDLNFEVGQFFGNAALNCGIDMKKIDFIASHGQTIWHEPRGKERNSTLQIGEPACIAQITQKTVVNNFRSAEVAVGRQGAPICGFLDASIISHSSLARVSQNIGGIGNVTAVIPRECGTGLDYLQFDTGPGNVLIDAAVRTLTNGKLQYDKDGILGLEGKRFIDNESGEKYVGLDYFSLPPPKTTGRELFSESMGKSIVEKLKNRGLIESAIIATITRVTAESIARAYEQFVAPRTPRKMLDEIYLCGGGAYNPNIVDHLKERFPEARIALINELSPISAASREATAFAILGYLCLHGMHTIVPSTVESAEPVVMGSITPGSNFHRLISSLKLTNGKFLRSMIFV